MIKETLQIFDVERNPRENVSYETIDKMIGAYDPLNEHQAPITIGHPKDDSPSYGLVGKIFRKGKDVFANVSYIPEFANMLKKGLFKFVSIAFNRKYKSIKGKIPYLRHLAFTPVPAIPGMKTTSLAPVTFSDDFEDYETFGDYEFNEKKEIKKKEKLMEYTKEQHESIVDAAVDRELKKREDELKTEFSYKEETFKATEKKLNDSITEKDKNIKKLSKDSEEYADNEIENKIDLLVSNAKILPADKDGLMEKYVKFKEKGAVELFYDEIEVLEKKDVQLEKGSHFNKKKDPNEKLKAGDMDPEEAKFHEQLGNSKEDIEEFADMEEFSIAYVSPRAKEKVD